MSAHFWKSLFRFFTNYPFTCQNICAKECICCVINGKENPCAFNISVIHKRLKYYNIKIILRWVFILVLWAEYVPFKIANVMLLGSESFKTSLSRKAPSLRHGIRCLLKGLDRKSSSVLAFSHSALWRHSTSFSEYSAFEIPLWKQRPEPLQTTKLSVPWS
jgi:hypothetical protein